MSKLPPRLPNRDDRHPRDSLMSYPDLPPSRRSKASPAPTSINPNHAQPKSPAPPLAPEEANPFQKPFQKPVQKPIAKPTPGRPRGRPRATIAKGMSVDVRDRKFAQIDKIFAKIKKGSWSSLPFVSHSD